MSFLHILLMISIVLNPEIEELHFLCFILTYWFGYFDEENMGGSGEVKTTRLN